jgi:hypothetical protein
MPRPNFAEDSLPDEDDSTRKPVTPEDTNRIERALVAGIGFYHAEHAVKLPGDEEQDEQVMSIPELLKVARGTAAFLPGKENHDAKEEPHEPPSQSRASGEVDCEENDKGVRSLGGCYSYAQLGKVHHMGYGMNNREEDDGPCDGDVKVDIFVEGNDLVEWCLAEQRDEVAADGKENEDDIDMKHESGCSSQGESDTKNLARSFATIFVLVVEETECADEEMEEDEYPN